MENKKKPMAVFLIITGIKGDNDRILLVHDKGKYKVTLAKLPGGMVVEGESPESTAIRKAMEETNLEVSLVSAEKRKETTSDIVPVFIMQKGGHTFQ